jgi:hypothetical protein
MEEKEGRRIITNKTVVKLWKINEKNDEREREINGRY